MVLILPFLRIRSELLNINYVMILPGEFMGKQSGEEQKGSLEEDMRAFFESATFYEKPRRKRGPKERKYKKGRKDKKVPKEQKEIPASISTDLKAFFDNGEPEDQKKSLADKKDDRDSDEGNIRGFFKEGMFEDQIRQTDKAKPKSFTCPYCGERLAMSVDTCDCGAEFVEEDKLIEAEITEFLDELEEEEEFDDEEEELEDEEWEAEPEPEEEDVSDEIIEDEIEAEVTVTSERLRRDRICFYAGAVLLLIGGPLIAFGSLLHDWFMVPLIGDTYTAFGWLNVTYAFVGFLILIIGIVLFAISLRGGIISNKELEKLKAKS